jgi:hypothetical protein
MWPFPGQVQRWIDAALARIEAEQSAQSASDG